MNSLTCPDNITLFPQDYVDCNCNILTDSDILIHPSLESSWLNPELVHAFDGKVRLTNKYHLPINLKQGQTLGYVSKINEPHSQATVATSLSPPTTASDVNAIKFNPQNMSIDPSWKTEFDLLHKNYESVFDSNLPGYDGIFCSIFAHVNVSDSLPPQRRGRVPQYSRDLLSELQDQFDLLESMGVFAKPEDLGVYAEYVNPSFLVKKTNGGLPLSNIFL